MRVALVNSGNNICEGITYLNDLNQVESPYIGIAIQEHDDVLYKKYIDTKWSEERFYPPEPKTEEFNLEQFMLDIDFRVTMIELGGM